MIKTVGIEPTICELIRIARLPAAIIVFIIWYKDKN